MCSTKGTFHFARHDLICIPEVEVCGVGGKGQRSTAAAVVAASVPLDGHANAAVPIDKSRELIKKKSRHGNVITSRVLAILPAFSYILSRARYHSVSLPVTP